MFLGSQPVWMTLALRPASAQELFEMNLYYSPPAKCLDEWLHLAQSYPVSDASPMLELLFDDG